MPTLHWIGKDKVINHHQDVPYRTLQHEYGFADGQKSDKQTNSGNKIIHGDNLEALKSLLPEYEGRIKCIYIDPPYNTGNESWVYNDNVNHPKIKKWLGQVVGKEGEHLSRHDKWLCMMYPRLKLLHKLLADDGAIFISIDDNEQANLRLICDEIFGGNNFVANIIWQKSYSPRMDVKNFSTSHDNIICYGKSINLEIKRIDFSQNKKQFKFFDNDKKLYYRRRSLRKEGKNSLRKDAPNSFFELIAPDGTSILPIKPNGIEGNWRWSLKKYEKELQAGVVEWIKLNDRWEVYAKQYYNSNASKPPETIWFHEEVGNNHEANDTIRKIFFTRIFDSPKPFRLITRILQIATNPGDIILDSFAGSGTTAHAVLNLNHEDGGERKFILIEMEDYAESITAERVRRVIDGYGEDKSAVEGTGGAFDYYTLGEPLFCGEVLNPELDIEQIREYVWYIETRQPYVLDGERDNPYFLGMHNGTAYYFYYNKDQASTLNRTFLKTIKKRAGQYIIYADSCLLSDEFTRECNIIFKKIPRDIARM